jgi:hypothetical protein
MYHTLIAWTHTPKTTTNINDSGMKRRISPNAEDRPAKRIKRTPRSRLLLTQLTKSKPSIRSIRRTPPPSSQLRTPTPGPDSDEDGEVPSDVGNVRVGKLCFMGARSRRLLSDAVDRTNTPLGSPPREPLMTTTTSDVSPVCSRRLSLGPEDREERQAWGGWENVPIQNVCCMPPLHQGYTEEEKEIFQGEMDEAALLPLSDSDSDSDSESGQGPQQSQITAALYEGEETLARNKITGHTIYDHGGPGPRFSPLILPTLPPAPTSEMLKRYAEEMAAIPGCMLPDEEDDECPSLSPISWCFDPD